MTIRAGNKAATQAADQVANQATNQSANKSAVQDAAATRVDIVDPVPASDEFNTAAGEFNAASAGLVVHDLTVRFGAKVAVAGAQFHVEPGEVLALLGPSGCGKSTLLRAITGLQSYEQGRVLWAGKPIDSVPVHKRGFGLMFQDGQLFPHRNVARNVAYGLKGLDLNRAEVQNRVDELLEMVGLPDFADRGIANLSGGERQRVALARALAPAPRLLLLDEPLSALDRDLRERLAYDLRRVLTATGTTAIFVTHDHDEAFAIADRIAVMNAGEILQIGPPQQVWRKPRNEIVAKFLGYRWFVDTETARLALHPGSFEIIEPGAEGDFKGFDGRVIGVAGAYRDGHLVRITTDTLGIIEARIPGRQAPAPDTQLQLTIRTDAVGQLAP